MSSHSDIQIFFKSIRLAFKIYDFQDIVKQICFSRFVVPRVLKKDLLEDGKD